MSGNGVFHCANKILNWHSKKNVNSEVWKDDEWSNIKLSEEALELLRLCKDLPKMEVMGDVNDVIRRSKQFPVPFPIETVRLEKLKARRSVEKLKKNIESTCPVIHERVILLMAEFMLFKRKFGSDVERSLYKDMKIPDLIDRILKNRAATFMKKQDQYKLLSGERGQDGWESVGTDQEKKPLVLENCLSYDEMKISAMVYVSSHTECINNGSRTNSGIVNEDDIETEAVIIGLIGPRFLRRNRMEYEDMLVTEEQNTQDNGYGTEKMDSILYKYRQLWSDFYKSPTVTYKDLVKTVNFGAKSSDVKRYSERYVKTTKVDGIFDNEVYYRRLRVTAETALLEADYRAKLDGKQAFLYIVGCGLGVWKISNHQLDVYILTFLDRILSFLKQDMLNNVSDVDFAYIKPTATIQAMFNSSKSKDTATLFLKHENHPNGGINIQLDTRQPATKLTGEQAGKLLVLTYPWDSNAHPGNEFWIGKLKTSGDPAAACSTQVSELHNAHINPVLTADNTMVVTKKGLVSLQQYCTELDCDK